MQHGQASPITMNDSGGKYSQTLPIAVGKFVYGNRKKTKNLRHNPRRLDSASLATLA